MERCQGCLLRRTQHLPEELEGSTLQCRKIRHHIPEKTSGGLEERQMESFVFNAAVSTAAIALLVRWLISKPHERIRRAVAFLGPDILYGIQTPLRLYRMRQLKRALMNLPEWRREEVLRVQHPGIPSERALKFAIHPSREVLVFVLYRLAQDLNYAFSAQENFRMREVPDPRLDLVAALEHRKERERLDKEAALCKSMFWKFHKAVWNYKFFGPEGIYIETSGVARVSYTDHLV